MDSSELLALRRQLAQQGQRRIDDWFSSEEFRKEQDKLLRAERAKERKAQAKGKNPSGVFARLSGPGNRKKRASSASPTEAQLAAISQALFDRAMGDSDD